MGHTNSSQGAANPTPAPAPMPVLAIDQTNPDALATVKRRQSQLANAKGRGFLSIPYSAQAATGSGISIPI